MTERDAIYIEILTFGLASMRNAALQGNALYCATESEHLHNLPSLIGETNEERHKYYFEVERNLYVERLDRSVPGVDFTMRRYEVLWRELERLNSGA